MTVAKVWVKANPKTKMPRHRRKVPLKYMRRFKGRLFCDMMDELIEYQITRSAERRGIPLHELMPNHYEEPIPSKYNAAAEAKNAEQPETAVYKGRYGKLERSPSSDSVSDGF